MVVSFRFLFLLGLAVSLVCRPAQIFAGDEEGKAQNPLIRAYEDLLNESEIKDEDQAKDLRKMLRDADEILTRIKQENREALKQVNRQLPGMAIGTPNIVLMLADDLDPAMIGAYGNDRVATPALDRVADEGMRFDDFHAGSPRDLDSFWCAFTGRNAMSISRDKNGKPVLSSPQSTLTSVAWHAGYNTGFFGAWPLDGPLGPTETFADTFVGFLGDECAKAYPPAYHVNGSQKDTDGKVFAWSITTMQALAAMEREKGSRPFCYVIRYHRVDLPAAEMEGLSVPGDLSDSQRARAARSARFDREVKQVLDHLDRKNQRDNTLLIVAGETAGGWEELANSATARAGEPALRAPLLVRWPRLVPAGQNNHELCGVVDLMPTLATILRDARYLSGATGKSLYQALVGQSGAAERLLYWRVPVENDGILQAVRLGHWKAILPPGSKDSKDVQLYDLAQDSGETKDVSADHPDVIEKVLRPGK